MWGRGGSKSGLGLSAVARETACSRKKETKENEEKGMRGSWRNRRIIWCGQHRAGRGKSKVHVVSGEVNQKNNEQVREVGERKVIKKKNVCRQGECRCISFWFGTGAEAGAWSTTKRPVLKFEHKQGEFMEMTDAVDSQLVTCMNKDLCWNNSNNRVDTVQIFITR